MQEIEKLKQEKNKLTTEFQNSRVEYKCEITKINRAIRSFEKGLSELSGTAVKTKRTKSHSEIEKILAENGALHLKQLYEKLNERGIFMSYQSLSGLMQLYAKAGKKFVKVSPATYALIEPDATAKPEVSAKPNNDNKPNTAVKKKALTKPNADMKTISNANSNSEPEAVEAKTAAEKQTIVYEVEEIEAGGVDNEE